MEELRLGPAGDARRVAESRPALLSSRLLLWWDTKGFLETGFCSSSLLVQSLGSLAQPPTPPGLQGWLGLRRTEFCFLRNHPEPPRLKFSVTHISTFTFLSGFASSGVMHCHAHPPTLPEGSGLHLRIWLYTPLLREYPSYINYKFLFFFFKWRMGVK